MAATFMAARGARETAAEPASQAAATPPAPVKDNASGGKGDAAKQAKPDTGRSDRAAERRAEKAKEARAQAAERQPQPAVPPSGGTVATVPGVPAPVARALSRKQVVVLFFRQRAADDRATAAAVQGVRGTKGVAVFQAPITRLAKYRGVVSGLDIAQAPVVIVVDRSRQGRVVEGYVDPPSLKQIVQDAK